MCAGTYSDPGFRKKIIQEFQTLAHRVAPSYGYDAVPVLAHALAAQRLRFIQVALTAGGAGVAVVLWMAGLTGFLGMLFLLGFAAWTFSFLRRLVVIETLVTRLKAEPFTGAYPQTSALTSDLIDRVAREQAVDGVIYYGGYKPFVGAGEAVKEWSNAQVLLPARVDPVAAAIGRKNGDGAAGGTIANSHESGRIISFSTEEITAFVERRLLTALREEAAQDRKVEGLTIERPRYRQAFGFGQPQPGGGSAGSDTVHWREDYHAAREYLCVRVGSWNQELVTSMFVGFDLRGETLYTEFHTYVLPPIKAGYHLVDRLPTVLGGKILRRAAWDAFKAVVARAFVPLAWLITFIDLTVESAKQRAAERAAETVNRVPAGGELNLSAYALPVFGRGAAVSIRELAASPVYHHFFQKSDADKYMKIVERCLLEAVETFLRDHNVDLADHAVFQNTILGDVIAHHGTGHISSRNSGTQTQGDGSPIHAAAGKGMGGSS